ncbi:tryptophan 7-halogenase [Aliiglaciecola sp. M165]|nr:tryptophan halogenase family protein [Aliiglaciecola sp. M165]TRY33330.1 tryptophan 7-halogenase [Aliiglaciecola sp. M165]
MMMSNQAINSVVIVGGGTAGWITAGRIAAEHQHNPSIEVTLIESPDISPIGVGEGTWPTMRTTLLKLGISESDFINQCDGSFKQGAKFAKWVTGEDDDFYYHPLVLPQGFHKTNLAKYWHEQHQKSGKSFSELVCYQEAICEQGLAPKTIRHGEFDALANYAYHLDSAKFSAFLQQHCTEKLGVKHVLANVESITSHDNNDIASVITKEAGEIFGDLFVDCTGFSALLIGKHYDVEFVPCDDVLFIDTALAVQVPYELDDSPIASHTISTAQDAGWIWDIGLQHRRGVGHVFSSRHTSKERAYEQLGKYVGEGFEQLQLREIPIKSGHRKIFWKNNCVAVGLSAGFLEPLEASALVLVELSAQLIAEQLPACRQVMDVVANRFNQTFDYRWQRIIDFLKLHYMLSKRTDNAFWVDNRNPDTIPNSLQELMTLWQYHPPADHDFSSNNEVFPAASYQYVLYGMGFVTENLTHAVCDRDHNLALQQFQLNQQAISKASRLLPSNRELINKIRQYGLQSV